MLTNNEKDEEFDLRNKDDSRKYNTILQVKFVVLPKSPEIKIFRYHESIDRKKTITT